MKRTKIIIALMLMIATAVCLFSLASCEEEGAPETGITSVEIKDGETVNLKVTLDETYAENHSADKLCILALSRLDPEGSLENAEVVAEGKTKKKMTFNFPLIDDNGESRVSNAFVLAEKSGEGYSAITPYAYISNPESLAYKKDSFDTAGLKGLLADDIFGAELLGATHIMLEASMDKLIMTGYSPDAVKFNFEGVSYFYNKSEVERLDIAAGEARDCGMKVYFRTVLGKSEDESLAFLYCSGAESAEGYLPDLSNAQGVRYIRAFYAFLADRYPVSDYIIGEKVNNHSAYCNAGDMSADGFKTMYAFWNRLAYQSLSSVNSEAAVCVPIDNYWRIDASENRLGAKAFLSSFAERAKNEGDYGYAISLDLGDCDDLPALISGREHDYSRIGAANLADMTAFMEKTEMRYRSDKRVFIIDGMSIPDKYSESERAAYYTFTYYSAAENGFSAVFCSSDVTSADIDRGAFYYSVFMCGTSLNSQLSDYTEKLPEVHIPSFDDYISSKLIYSQAALLEIEESAASKRSELNISLDEILHSGNVYNVQGVLSEKDGERHTFKLIEADIREKTGAVYVKDIPADELLGAKYIGITISSESAPTVALVISNGKDMYIGEAITANDETAYYFDISKFAKEADGASTLTLSICIMQNGDGQASLEIHDISLYGKAGVDAETVIVIVVVAVVVLALVGLIVLLVVKRSKKAGRSGNGKEDRSGE